MPVYPQGFGTSKGLYPADGIEGMLVDSIPHDYVTPNLINVAGKVAQVSTIAVGTAATSTSYTVRVVSAYDTGINELVTITSGGADTATDIATKILNALKANSVIFSVFDVTSSTSNVLLTSRRTGVENSYTVSVSGGGTGYAVSLTTAPNNGSVIPFGYVIATGASDTARTGKLPVASGDVPRGVAVRTDASEITQTGVDGINLGAMINTLCVGRIWVRPTTAFKPTDVVYYSYDSVTKGTVRAGTATNHAILPGAKFENAGAIGDLAILRVNM
jgi:hypothetical protein